MWKPPSSIDIDLPDEIGDDDYLAWLDNALRSGLRQFQPELLCYLAGADPYCEDQLGGLSQRRNSRAAAQIHQIVQDGVGAQAELFGHIAGDPRAQVAGARADQEGVELVGPQSGPRQRLGDGGARQARRFAAKRGVQFILGQIENMGNVVHREVARRDAVVAGQDGAQDELRAPVEPVQGRRLPPQFPALALGEGGGRHRGGEGVEIHGSAIQCVSW